MFSPTQVQDWRSRPKSTSDNKFYLGFELGSFRLDFNGPYDPSLEKIPTGKLYKPSEIFGNPADPTCLDGIANHAIDNVRPLIDRFPRSRIIGNSALLTEDGRLLTPRDESYGTKERFTNQNAWGHQGFLFEDVDEGIAIYFMQYAQSRANYLDALFLPNIEPGNFGSFILRQLPQMTLARSLGENFDCYITAERTSFFLEAIELLHLPRKPIFTVREVAGQCFKSISTTWVNDAEGFLSQSYVNEIRHLVHEVINDYGPLAGSDKIYVSRLLSTRRQPWYRVMINEKNVEDVLEKLDYKVVYPETLSLRDQIRTFSSAREVIGPSGSGMFNSIFSLHKSKIVDIESFHVTVRQHAKFYSSCGLKYSFLFTPFVDHTNQDKVTRPYICPMDLLNQAVSWIAS